jgi:protein phosphatase
MLPYNPNNFHLAGRDLSGRFADRQFGPHVVRNHSQQLRRSMRGLEREGFRHVFVLSTPEEVSLVSITRQPLWNKPRNEHGPFDSIGDVHGCYEELTALFVQIGYRIESDQQD